MKRLGGLWLALIVVAVSCGGDQPKKSDSVVYIDVVDINAKAAPPPEPVSHIGRLQLLSEPVGGTCNIHRYRGMEVVREIWYDADRPRRNIVLSVGKPSRAFLPISLNIIGTQGDGVNNEQEVIVASFTAEGAVNVGTRSYSSTGREEVSEKVQLSPDDRRNALIFVGQLMTLCENPAR